MIMARPRPEEVEASSGYTHQVFTVQKPKSYEKAAIEIAVDLTREIVRLLQLVPSEGAEAEQLKRYNINRAYSAIDHLQRIDV